jgi:hypothetical protein
MKRGLEYILLAIYVTLLCGCGPVESPTIVIPTNTETPTATRDLAAALTTKVAATKSAKETNIALTPTITPTVRMPLETILQDFPLEVGTRWVYYVTIEYRFGEWIFTEDGEAIEPPWRTWTGFITQSVTERTEQPQSVHPTFTISVQNYPNVTVNGIELDNHETIYVIKHNSIYQNEIRWIKWPLEVGAFWDPWDEYANPQEPRPKLWNVLNIESVETGIGTLNDCFLSQLAPPGDVISYWICPGVGIGKIYGWSSSGTIFEWVLQSFYTPA